MPHLLIIAHGSRREQSNLEIRELVERLTAINHQFEQIDCAFLELANPSIPEGLEKQIADGAEHIVVMPYFLSAGRHVAQDIPELVDAVQKQNPHITIQIAHHLGAANSIPALLLNLAGQTLELTNTTT